MVRRGRQTLFSWSPLLVGENTKVYGAALSRLRKEDFSNVEHEEGVSPAWPVSYEEFEPYYCRAEQMLSVHGESGIDPTEPPRSAPFPFPAVPHEPYVEDLKTRLERQNLHPYFLPLGIDLRQGGKCIRCQTCDGFPCKVHAKSEADVSCVRPALESGNIELLTRTLARRLITDGSGKPRSRLSVAAKRFA
jgi:choline dehydrogenase-like flavoprotein